MPVSLVVPSAGPPGPVDGLSIEKLRAMVQDCHLSFLVGAGASASLLKPLGNIEDALTSVAASTLPAPEKEYLRASLQGHFLSEALAPNIPLMDRDPSTEPTLGTYLEFLGALNQILLNRRSSLLSKQTSIFTTNVDMLFEVALDLLEIEANDGFAGRIRPRLDLGAFNTVRLRQGTTYEYRSEIPVVNLMKLHGSLGWRTSGESAVYLDNDLKTLRDAMEAHTRAVGDLVDHDVMVTTLEDCGRKGSFASLVALAAGKSLNADGQAFADAYALLTIVNPEKTKFALTVLNHTYYDLIRRFANEMERENSLLLALGFSFRNWSAPCWPVVRVSC